MDEYLTFLTDHDLKNNIRVEKKINKSAFKF